MMGNTNSGRRPAHVEMNLQRGEVSSRQLSDLTGVSMRTLDWWAKSGILVPARQDGKGKGSRRVYRETVAVDDVKHLVLAIRACPYEHKTA